MLADQRTGTTAQPQDEEPILDAATYHDPFEKINQAVFLRASMTTTTSIVDRSLGINAH